MVALVSTNTTFAPKWRNHDKGLYLVECQLFNPNPYL